MSKLKIGPVSAEKENETEKVEAPKCEAPKRGQRGTFKPKPYHKQGFIKASPANVLKHRPQHLVAWNGKSMAPLDTVPHHELDTYRQTKLYLAGVRAALAKGEVLVFLKVGGEA